MASEIEHIRQEIASTRADLARDVDRLAHQTGSGRLAGRLTWLPYYDEISNGRYLIHTGLGILYTDETEHQTYFTRLDCVERFQLK